MIDAKTDLLMGITPDGKLITEREINPYEYYSYEEFCVDLGLIYQYIIKNNLDKKIKAVYGIPNGGMILATFIANKFGWELVYLDDYNIPIGMKNNLTYDNDEVLFVDDVADSGNTLKKLSSLFKEPITTITIHHKPQSVFEPSFYCKSTNKWVVYFWEKEYIHNN